VHATGFEPGGVAPFPQRAIARTLIDSSLLGWNTVWIGAGTASHMAELPPSDLQRLTKAAAFDLAPAG
jgi:prolyl-tRNA editing enzyme YbaK/EbsC (Cys-tRNA(Pro) deacylase)